MHICTIYLCTTHNIIRTATHAFVQSNSPMILYIGVEKEVKAPGILTPPSCALLNTERGARAENATENRLIRPLNRKTFRRSALNTISCGIKTVWATEKLFVVWNKSKDGLNSSVARTSATSDLFERAPRSSMVCVPQYITRDLQGTCMLLQQVGANIPLCIIKHVFIYQGVHLQGVFCMLPQTGSMGYHQRGSPADRAAAIMLIWAQRLLRSCI